MAAAPGTRPPVGKDSVKFLVIGDSGTGDRAQIETAQQMWKVAQRLPVRVRHHARRQHVRLRASAGLRAQVRAAVQAAARRQDRLPRGARQSRRSRTRCITSRSAWAASGSTPIRRRTRASSRSTATTWTRTSSAGSSRSSRSPSRNGRLPTSITRSTRRAAATDRKLDLRSIIEPLFIKYNLNVVFAGHEHFYERLKPQKGIHYFTAGGSAKLRAGDIVGRRDDRQGFRHRSELHDGGDRWRGRCTTRPSRAAAG